MTTLVTNWFTEGLTDFEYKKYMLLAYLQQVHQTFEEHKLYPALAELVQNYRSLTQFVQTKQKLANEFPKVIKKADLKNFRLVYESVVQDDAVMEEISRIVDYSLPRMARGLEEGRHHYDEIESHLLFAPIGITPLYKTEGYLLLKNGPEPETKVYQYKVTIFETANEQYRGLHTTYIGSYPRNLVYTYENIKKELLKTHRELPNPATYIAESPVYYPFEESLLPIASRLLVRKISVG